MYSFLTMDKKDMTFVANFSFYYSNQLQAASLRTSSAIFLSQFASLNALVNSILAVSTSRDNSIGSSIAECAKSTLAFTIKGSKVRSQVIFAGFTTVREAIDSTFSRVVVSGIRIVAGRSHNNASKENNSLFQKIENV